MNCPQCNTPLPSDTPGTLCPACLLKRGLEPNTLPPTLPPTATWSPPTPEDLAPFFPDLDLLSLLGRGGMGAVYKARQKSLDRIVALKILPPQISHDANFAQRFTHEAQSLAKLNHPHIVAIYDFGTRSGQLSVAIGQDETPSLTTIFFFLMEYIDGLSLRQLLNASHLDPTTSLAIVPQICDALQYAHDRGIVHRDIKPENILLTKSGQIKIADFGLAKLMTPQDSPLKPQDSSIAGTPHYMAPEQSAAPTTVDHRADIYALGVVFYQMLTGELPKDQFLPPSKKVLIDVRLDEIILRALEQNPEARYQNATQFKTEIETVINTPQTPPTPTNVAPGGNPGLNRPSPSQPSSSEAIQSSLRIPSIGLRIATTLNLLALLFVTALLTLSRAMAIPGARFQTSISGSVLILIVIALLLNLFILRAAINMPRLKSYNRAVAACILSLFVLPANLLALPFAIWAFILLARPETRAAFDQTAPPLSPPPPWDGSTVPSQSDTSIPPPRFSRTAILGAFWATLFFAVVPAFLAHEFQTHEFWNHGLFVSPLGAFVFFLFILPAFTAPFAVSILGAIALAQIRRSTGRLYGLPLALFDTLLFPLLLLDALILYASSVPFGIDLTDNHSYRFGIMLCICLWIDTGLIRWAWDTLNPLSPKPRTLNLHTFLSILVISIAIILLIPTGHFFASNSTVLLNTRPSTQLESPPSTATKPSLPLTLLDDFSVPETSRQNWTPIQQGTASITFEPHRVLLDMPPSPTPGNRADLFLNTPLHLRQKNETLRLIWDMQLLEDRPNAYYSGLALGSQQSKRIVVAQSGLKNNDPSQGRPHDFMLTGAPYDNIDHGTAPFHYDLTVTLDDPATGASALNLLVYKQTPALDSQPENYAQETPIATLQSHASLPINTDPQLFFFIDRDDGLGDPVPNQARSKIAISHLFTSSTLPSASESPAPPPTAAAIPSFPHSLDAHLPNGGTVRLLAITDTSLPNSHWWAPDGTPVTPLPDWIRQAQIHWQQLKEHWKPDVQKENRLLAFFSADYPQNIPPAQILGPTGEKWPGPYYFFTTVPSKEIPLMAGLSVGAWTEVGALHAGETLVHGEIVCKIESVDPATAKSCTVLTTLTRIPDPDVIPVAVARDGKEHSLIGDYLPRAGLPSIEYGLPIRWKQEINFPAGDVDHFLILSRPREWATFSNFARSPGELLPASPQAEFTPHVQSMNPGINSPPMVYPDAVKIIPITSGIANLNSTQQALDQAQQAFKAGRLSTADLLKAQAAHDLAAAELANDPAAIATAQFHAADAELQQAQALFAAGRTTADELHKAQRARNAAAAATQPDTTAP